MRKFHFIVQLTLVNTRGQSKDSIERVVNWMLEKEINRDRTNNHKLSLFLDHYDRYRIVIHKTRSIGPTTTMFDSRPIFIENKGATPLWVRTLDDLLEEPIESSLLSPKEYGQKLHKKIRK